MPREMNKMSCNTTRNKLPSNASVDKGRKEIHLSREEEKLRSPSCNRRRRGSSRSRSRSLSRSRHNRNKTKSSYTSHRSRRPSSRSRSRSTSHHRRLEKFRNDLTSPVDGKVTTKLNSIKNGKSSSDQTNAAESSTSFSENLRSEIQRTTELEKISSDEMEEPVDKEKIHKEIEEKLRLTLAKEGKIYPPPKPEASHPIFANDGSFLELFKKMQEQSKQNQQADNLNRIAKPLCKRRGGKILKTGIVTKPKAEHSNTETGPKDFWSIYLQEVKKYKSSSCDIESKTRPLVK